MTRLWDVVLIPVAIHVCMSMAEHIISLPLCKVRGLRDGRGGCVWLAGLWLDVTPMFGTICDRRKLD